MLGFEDGGPPCVVLRILSTTQLFADPSLVGLLLERITLAPFYDICEENTKMIHFNCLRLILSRNQLYKKEQKAK